MEKGIAVGRKSERARIIEALRSQGVSEEIIAKVLSTAEEEEIKR